jgi:hypothetical protein
MEVTVADMAVVDTAAAMVGTVVVIGATEAAAMGVDTTAGDIMGVLITMTDIMMAAHITEPHMDSLSALADTVGEVAAGTGMVGIMVTDRVHWMLPKSRSVPDRLTAPLESCVKRSIPNET